MKQLSNQNPLVFVAVVLLLAPNLPLLYLLANFNFDVIMVLKITSFSPHQFLYLAAFYPPGLLALVLSLLVFTKQLGRVNRPRFYYGLATLLVIALMFSCLEAYLSETYKANDIYKLKPQYAVRFYDLAIHNLKMQKQLTYNSLNILMDLKQKLNDEHIFQRLQKEDDGKIRLIKTIKILYDREFWRSPKVSQKIEAYLDGNLKLNKLSLLDTNLMMIALYKKQIPSKYADKTISILNAVEAICSAFMLLALLMISVNLIMQNHSSKKGKIYIIFLYTSTIVGLFWVIMRIYSVSLMNMLSANGGKNTPRCIFRRHYLWFSDEYFALRWHAQ